MTDYPMARPADDGMDKWLQLPRDYGNVDALGYNLWSPPGSAIGYPPVVMYKMRGEDAVVDGRYDSWLVRSEPDLDASEYTGALARPLRDVVVIDTWTA